MKEILVKDSGLSKLFEMYKLISFARLYPKSSMLAFVFSSFELELRNMAVGNKRDMLFQNNQRSSELP